mmetsp:Transcript_7616/g.19574  ORF Transcript_7616/g.19574 Transcript_7616/m.19574 type:complete len:482 (-) Transcript_7616:87-1532(-)
MEVASLGRWRSERDQSSPKCRLKRNTSRHLRALAVGLNRLRQVLSLFFVEGEAHDGVGLTARLGLWRGVIAVAGLAQSRFDDLKLLCFLSLTARLCAIALCPTVVQQQKAGPVVHQCLPNGQQRALHDVQVLPHTQLARGVLRTPRAAVSVNAIPLSAVVPEVPQILRPLLGHRLVLREKVIVVLLSSPPEGLDEFVLHPPLGPLDVAGFALVQNQCHMRVLASAHCCIVLPRGALELVETSVVLAGRALHCTIFVLPEEILCFLPLYPLVSAELGDLSGSTSGRIGVKQLAADFLQCGEASQRRHGIRNLAIELCHIAHGLVRCLKVLKQASLLLDLEPQQAIQETIHPQTLEFPLIGCANAAWVGSEVMARGFLLVLLKKTHRHAAFLHVCVEGSSARVVCHQLWGQYGGHLKLALRVQVFQVLRQLWMVHARRRAISVAQEFIEDPSQSQSTNLVVDLEVLQIPACAHGAPVTLGESS